MTTDFLNDVDFLKAELMEFYRVVRHGDEATAAVARLQTALNRVEGSVGELPQLTEQALPQRWGYVQLVSLMGTIKEELKGLRLRHRSN
jgi:hypothetical protein